MQNTQSYSRSSQKTMDLIITAMLIALVFLSTFFLNIKLPIAANGGLVHLGTAMLFIASILFGPKNAALAGAIGMGLFDIVGGWTLWAPITIVARGLQGYIVGKIAWSKGRNGTSIAFNVIATIVSIPFMIAVYYIGEGILYGNWIAPLASIPGDLVQNILGIIVAVPVCVALKKVPYFK
ncbi:ECF transporter S component [Peribacillus frigoritolerans]|uniref:ECF transporter S component n=1 Tax=Peribacillus TaxID=2675229 RepID=UPI002079CE8D|nr:ECF transporter S component [Peribacillus frigoritolerans]MEB2631903.1 ECF transporter S component [Peribacillus frigoritolerans]MED4691263.1 ECF transporter S component [Peribacillus frigoritolerans]USK82619.1 ECF transporter S component [Peribacillus frigoritolerans]